MKLAVIDLDGTLFDDSHRRHYADAGNWKAYHERHEDDRPYLTMFRVAEIWAAKGFQIAFLTGRHESYRESTFSQICKCSSTPIDGSFLLMRQDDDISPTSDFKAKIVRQLILTHSLGAIVFYDDCKLNLKSVGDVCQKLNIEFSMYLANSGTAKLIDSYLAIEHSAKPMLQLSTAEILRSMADTFEERNKVYGSNYERVAPIMKILFPDGLPPEILHSDQWHLFELIVVKITRFAISGLQHKDSIHDTGVYAAMIESILEKQNG